MKRPRWHDFVIVFSVLALFGAGIGAIWGGAIKDAIDGIMESGDRGGESPPASPAPTGTEIDLL